MNLLSISTRTWLVLGSAALLASGALGVACSNGNPVGGDAGKDAGGSDVKNDTARPDGSQPDGGGGTDGGGNDGSTGPCATTFITGACDIVAQDCPSGNECVQAQGSDGGTVTACQPVGSGSYPEGHTCTPNANNPCTAGLECISGRCAKHCCLGNDSQCGASTPEGYLGRCDLTIVDNNNNPMYAVCTYSPGCQPFDIQACAAGQTCLITDSAGTASCTDIFGADGGLPEKATCTAANACADGMYCLNTGDAGSCIWMCYYPPGPYDAGVANLGAGKGGCPNGETCHSNKWGGSLPTWLGFCQ